MTTQAAGLRALLTLLVAVTAAHAAKMMDMSPMAVDDQFVDCDERMMQKVMDPQGLLMKELKDSKEFKDAWKSVAPSSPLSQQHIQALEAYSSDEKFRKMFNQAVGTQGWNISTYSHSFSYKSLHFLLTDTLRRLRQGCHTVYRGSETVYDAKVGSTVRFGRFTAVGNQKSYAEESVVDEGTVFNITSCSAVKIEDYVHKNSEVSWLVAPFEVFKVTRVRETDEYKEITLVHHTFHSNHNCYMFRDLDPSGRAVTFSAPLTLCLSVSLWAATKLFD